MTEENPTTPTTLLSYVEPGKADVLCGRGGKQFNHHGNQVLRIMIAACLDSYISVGLRRDRGMIIADIAKKIMEKGGRFLLFDKVSARWFDGGMKAAKNRIGSAFRDGSKPGKVKLMESLKKSLTTTLQKRSSGFPPSQCQAISLSVTTDDGVNEIQEEMPTHNCCGNDESLHMPLPSTSKDNMEKEFLPPRDGHADTFHSDSLIFLTQTFPNNIDLESSVRQQLDDCPLPIQSHDASEKNGNDALFWNAQELLQALSSEDAAGTNDSHRMIDKHHHFGHPWWQYWH